MIYVCYHELELLEAFPIRDCRRILLRTCDETHAWPGVCESAALANMSEPDYDDPVTHFIQASWPRKFSLFPVVEAIETLDQLVQTHPAIYAPIVDVDWYAHSLYWHPGIDRYLEPMMKGMNWSTYTGSPGIFCNTFSMPTAVWRTDFLPTWKRAYGILRDAWRGHTLVFPSYKAELNPAFLCERITTAWSANQEGLGVARLQVKERSGVRGYEVQRRGRSTTGSGVSSDSAPVTVCPASPVARILGDPG